MRALIVTTGVREVRDLQGMSLARTHARGVRCERTLEVPRTIETRGEAGAAMNVVTAVRVVVDESTLHMIADDEMRPLPSGTAVSAANSTAAAGLDRIDRGRTDLDHTGPDHIRAAHIAFGRIGPGRNHVRNLPGRIRSGRNRATRIAAARTAPRRGPKGYQRSDDRLKEQVSDRLMDDAQIDASEITVEMHNGEVTLAGTVNSREEKRAAEACAESVSGVREVINQSRVNRGDGSSTSSSPSVRSASASQTSGSQSQTSGSQGQSSRMGRSSSSERSET
jgi:hypothetical protein